MTERAADHVPLPHPDQIIDDQSVGDVGYQTATQFVRWEGRSLLCPSVPSPIRHPKQDVRVSDVRLPKHAAAAVARAVAQSCVAQTEKLVEVSNRDGDPRVAEFIRQDSEFRAMGYVLRARGQVTN